MNNLAVICTAEYVKHHLGKIAFTNGCFDLLTSTHVRFFTQARNLIGTLPLVVAINSDASVRRLKGEGRPLNTFSNRAEVISALRAVNYIIPYPDLRDDRVTGLIQFLKPAMWVKGGYSISELDASEVRAANECNVLIKLIPPIVGPSTTSIVASMHTPKMVVS